MMNQENDKNNDANILIVLDKNPAASLKAVPRNNAESGYSLIELMVSITIGLFLLAGIVTSFVSSKSASMKRDQTSLLEDNGRYALEAITEALEHTGYTPANSGALPTQFIRQASDIVSDTCPVSAIQNVVNTSIFNTTDDGASGDSLGVIYHADTMLFTDCAGKSLPASCRLKPIPSINMAPESSRIYNSFFVDNTNKTLMCSGSRSSAPEVIAEGVENIQFLYGIDTGNDGQVDRYVNASNMAGRWSSVVSIQVAMLVRSPKIVKTRKESKRFTLLDVAVISPYDKYQRAVFSTTVRLRNTL